MKKNVIHMLVNKDLTPGILSADENCIKVIVRKVYHPEDHALVEEGMAKDGYFYRFENQGGDQHTGIDMNDYHQEFR